MILYTLYYGCVAVGKKKKTEMTYNSWFMDISLPQLVPRRSLSLPRCLRFFWVLGNLGVSWCCGNYCLLAFVLWCGYCSVSFQSFVLRHWCPQHQETTGNLVGETLTVTSRLTIGSRFARVRRNAWGLGKNISKSCFFSYWSGLNTGWQLPVRTANHFTDVKTMSRESS